jgi:lauroyl/myristoyl acyltransferase
VNGLARFGGRCVYTFAGRLRDVGHENLDLVYGKSKSAAEKKAILKTSIVHFVRSTLDLFWFTRDTEARCNKYVTFAPNFDKLLNNEPALCLTGHLGNWEVMGVAYAQRGHILFSVAAPLKNAEVDKLFIAAREQTGQTIVPQKGAIRRILRGLKEGGKMAVLLDQNTRPKDGGVFINFCDRKVPVSPAPAAIALKAQAPIHVVYCLPDMNGHYTAYSPVEVPYSADTNAEELTQIMSNAFTEAILEHPECWLWSYKRFKYVPKGEALDTYPSYAKPQP